MTGAEAQSQHVGVLFQPFRLGPLTLANRVVFPGHTTNFGIDTLPTDRHIAYHRRRALGGVGTIITEAIRVHPTSAGRDSTLGSYHPDAVRAFAALTEAIHSTGTVAIAQIMHAGRQAAGDSARTAAWSPGDTPWTSGAAVPHAMTNRDIRTVVGAFGEAASRMRSADFDAIEVHLGHGHLLQQFLSPAINRRTDDYGGGPEGRMRLSREVLAAVFDAIPSTMPVGIRLSADEFLEGGLGVDDMVAIVRALSAEFSFAFLHVSHSAYVGQASLATQIADMSHGPAPFRAFPRRFKQEFPTIPVIGVCRIDDVDVAAELVRAKDADLVAMGRAQIADPDLLVKARTGRRHETRSCLACNQACIGRIEMNLPLACVVNPAAGTEQENSSAESAAGASVARRKGCRVVVVGAGPAGLEAALTARRAGCEVIVVERCSHVGGQVADARRVEGRERLGLAVDELERDARRLGIRIELGHAVTPEDPLLRDADHVVVATGARQNHRRLPGPARTIDVMSAIDLLAGAEPLPNRVVVVDDEGSWIAASVVESLASRGVAVDVLSPTASICGGITTYSRVGLLDRWRRLGVTVHPLRRPIRSTSDGVVVIDTFGGHESLIEGAGLVIDVPQRTADDRLFCEIERVLPHVPTHMVGDAVAPRSLTEAIYEGRVVVLAALRESRLDQPISLSRRQEHES